MEKRNKSRSTRLYQVLENKLQELIRINEFFFDSLKNDYQRTQKIIIDYFSDKVPAFKIALWADLDNQELRTQLEDLGGYMVALKKEAPVKVINELIKHLDYNKQFLRLAEDCFYFYKYQDHYTTIGKSTIDEFTYLHTAFQKRVLTDKEKDTLFKLCSRIRQQTATNHLKRYAEPLLGISYDVLHQIMNDCYMGCLVIKTDTKLDLFI